MVATNPGGPHLDKQEQKFVDDIKDFVSAKDMAARQIAANNLLNDSGFLFPSQGPPGRANQIFGNNAKDIFLDLQTKENQLGLPDLEVTSDHHLPTFPTADLTVPGADGARIDIAVSPAKIVVNAWEDGNDPVYKGEKLAPN